MFHLVLSCLVWSCLVLSCLVSSCLVLSCPILSCPVLSCLAVSCIVLPYDCIISAAHSTNDVPFTKRSSARTMLRSLLRCHGGSKPSHISSFRGASQVDAAYPTHIPLHPSHLFYKQHIFSAIRLSDVHVDAVHMGTPTTHHHVIKHPANFRLLTCRGNKSTQINRVS